MSDMDEQTARERLREAARERWGENWTIRVTEYADGSTDIMAFSSNGVVEVDGERVIERERLLFDADGEIVHDRVRLTKQRVVETDRPEPPTN